MRVMAAGGSHRICGSSRSGSARRWGPGWEANKSKQSSMRKAIVSEFKIRDAGTGKP